MTKGQSAPNGSTAAANVGGSQPTADPGAAFTAPVASAGRGRGRGRGGVDNRPAWMTQGQSAGLAPVVDSQQSSTPPTGEAVFAAPPTGMGMGRGRGRGGVDNRPAWMTKGQNVQMSATGIQAGGPHSGSQAQAADGGIGRGRGRGRGRGIDNRPAWMSKQESAG